MKLPYSLLAALFLSAAPAVAETLQVNLGYIPALSHPYQEGSTWWNKLNTWGVISTPVTLYDTDNTATSVTWETRVGFTSYSNADFGESVYEYPESVANGSFYITGATVAQVVISGLETDRDYQFTLYGNVRNVAVQRGMTISLQGSGAASSQDLLLSGTATRKDETEVIFSSVRADSNGQVTLNFSRTDGYDRGVVNALVIHSIPEPGTAAAGLVGGATLIALGGAKNLLRRKP